MTRRPARRPSTSASPSRSPTAASQTLVRMSGPDEALEAIPHLFGFAPSESLVLMALCGPRGRIGPALRMDLTGPEGSDDEVIATQAMAALMHQVELRSAGRHLDVNSVIAIVYTDEGDDDPMSPLPRLDLLAAVRRRCRALDLDIRDALVVRHGRWSSVLCDDPACCPPEGTPLVPDIPSAAALTLTFELGTPMASRAEIAESVAPRVAEGMAEAIAAVVSELAPLTRLSRMGQALQVEQHVLDVMAGNGAPDRASTVLLIALAQDTTLRDLFVTITTPEDTQAAVALWRVLLVATPAPYDAQVAAILAQLAWESGQGALAHCACERALTTDPEHVLAGLIYQALSHGLPAPSRQADDDEVEDWDDLAYDGIYGADETFRADDFAGAGEFSLDGEFFLDEVVGARPDDGARGSRGRNGKTRGRPKSRGRR